MKPFFIYTDKDSLYFKKISGDKKKLAKNIYTYTVSIDENNDINIFCIDNFKKLIYISNIDSKWQKKIICKINNPIKNIDEIKCYLIKSQFNLFITEKYHVLDNSYKVTHINFEKDKFYKIHKYYFKNIVKNNNIYNLNIDKNNNILFEYEYNNFNKIVKNELTFDYSLKSWIQLRKLNESIKYNINRYSNSIIYKM